MAKTSKTDQTKQRLETERERLLHDLGELEEATRIDRWADSRTDVADAGAAVSEREQSGLQAEQLRARLNAIDDAIERIAAGTYGSCEVCGKRIRKERLEALPATTLCVEHASSRR